MDEHTLNVLDYPRIRELLADLAQTDLGRSRAQGLMPFARRAEVEHEFALVEELLSAAEDPPLGAVADIRPLLEPGGGGRRFLPRRNCWSYAAHWKPWARCTSIC